MKIGTTLTKCLLHNLDNNVVPLLVGEPGIGKSEGVDALARALNTRVHPLSCNQLADKADLTGARLVQGVDKTWRQEFFPHTVVKAAVDDALANPNEPVILFLDEINRTTPDVTSAVLTLLTTRSLGNVDLPDNVKMIAAGNDKGNITALDDASMSRFAVYHLEPETQAFLDYMGDELNPYIRKVLAKNPMLIFEKSAPSTFAVDGSSDDDDGSSNISVEQLMDSGEEMFQLTTPRTIEYMSRFLNTVTKKDPGFLGELLLETTVVNGQDATALQEVIHGHLGNTNLATLLIEEIADDLNSGNVPQGSAIVVPRPARYDELKAAATIHDLDVLIRSMTPKEQSGCLLQAIHEQTDNTTIVQQLAAATPGWEPEHSSVLLNLASQADISVENFEALCEAGGPLSSGARAIGDLVGLGS